MLEAFVHGFDQCRQLVTPIPPQHDRRRRHLGRGVELHLLSVTEGVSPSGPVLDQTVPPRRLSTVTPTPAEMTSAKPGGMSHNPKTIDSIKRNRPIPSTKGHTLESGNAPITPAPSSMEASVRSSGRGF